MGSGCKAYSDTLFHNEPSQSRRLIASVHNGLVGSFKEEPELRIHQMGLLGVYAEELRIEAREVL